MKEYISPHISLETIDNSVVMFDERSIARVVLDDEAMEALLEWIREVYQYERVK